MGRGKFFGGVHPSYNKGLADSHAIVEMPLPEKLVVFFAQNLGAPSQPVVKKGDEVKKGQVIAESGGFIHRPSASTLRPRLSYRTEKMNGSKGAA